MQCLRKGKVKLIKRLREDIVGIRREEGEGQGEGLGVRRRKNKRKRIKEK